MTRLLDYCGVAAIPKGKVEKVWGPQTKGSHSRGGHTMIELEVQPGL